MKGFILIHVATDAIFLNIENIISIKPTQDGKTLITTTEIQDGKSVSIVVPSPLNDVVAQIDLAKQ